MEVVTAVPMPNWSWRYFGTARKTLSAGRARGDLTRRPGTAGGSRAAHGPSRSAHGFFPPHDPGRLRRRRGARASWYASCLAGRRSAGPTTAPRPPSRSLSSWRIASVDAVATNSNRSPHALRGSVGPGAGCLQPIRRSRPGPCSLPGSAWRRRR